MEALDDRVPVMLSCVVVIMSESLANRTTTSQDGGVHESSRIESLTMKYRTRYGPVSTLRDEAGVDGVLSTRARVWKQIIITQSVTKDSELFILDCVSPVHGTHVVCIRNQTHRVVDQPNHCPVVLPGVIRRPGVQPREVLWVGFRIRFIAGPHDLPKT